MTDFEKLEDQPIIDAFKNLINDSSGMIESEDLKQLLMGLGEKFSEEEADALIKDAGGGSSFDFEKFVKKMNVAANKDPMDDADD
jgi:Ca2+-binding EF-hand superfamily protein